MEVDFIYRILIPLIGGALLGECVWEKQWNAAVMTAIILVLDIIGNLIRNGVI